MSKATRHGDIPAPDAVLTVLGEAPGVRIVDHDCRKPAGARGSYEYGLDYGLVSSAGRVLGWTSMAGARTWDLRTRSSSGPFVEQRIAHHRADGDRCTSLWLSESAV